MLPGTLTITAHLPGFRTFERTDFAIGVGRTLNLDIVMTIGQLEATITVSRQAFESEEVVNRLQVGGG